ncbi:carbohydrate-binding protein with CBM35 doain [Nonomuraea polychroma]|uniref:Carbohydrate-binding protein with CBM35 doain n=1 Tax=Nonomuraea polychroma TaxID=46176 RepID=A0A438MAC4_9ACTN|nr:CBM35 domain-containing protein [Nonomuraea polychroma]RVX42585.1 carbohydrate-binding protein with CBM35 doain [Nonomuraea polychroma]
MTQPLSRRRFGLLLGAAAAVPLLPARPAFAAPTLLPSGMTWQLMWSPSASANGMGAWETIEDDRADSHPAGAPHIRPDGDNYRFTMHMVDRDTSTDRQRHEVTGNRTSSSSYLSWKTGELWRVTYSMYIPSTLKATTTFTHIFQTKMPGSGTSPITVTSLRRVDGRQTIEHKIFEPNILVGRTDLEPLHNKWIDIDYEIKIGDGSAGAVRWVVRNGGTTVVDATTTGVDTFLGDRVRPKWGIYRSLGDTSGSLQDCHLLLTRLRSYKAVPGGGGGVTRYEAENATISQGAVESNHAGYSGTGFVNGDNAAGSYVEWTVNGAAGAATLRIRYANGTTAGRPATITVNGATVAADQPFNGTGAWATWATATVPVTLRSGANTVRITANTAAGNPNLDYLEVVQ